MQKLNNLSPLTLEQTNLPESIRAQNISDCLKILVILFITLLIKRKQVWMFLPNAKEVFPLLKFLYKIELTQLYLT